MPSYAEKDAFDIDKIPTKKGDFVKEGVKRAPQAIDAASKANKKAKLIPVKRRKHEL